MSRTSKSLLVMIVVLALVAAVLLWRAAVLTDPMLESLREIVGRSDEYYDLLVAATQSAP